MKWAGILAVHGTDEEYIQNLVEKKPEMKRPSERLGVDGRILKSLTLVHKY
jgi:hypothetical protein